MKDDRVRMAKASQHAQAAYWNGSLTRAEAQKVFDETAAVVSHHQQTIMKLDMVVAYLVEKAGHTTEQIQEWMNERVKAAQAAQDAAKAANVQTAPEEPVTAPLVTLD